MWRTYRVMIYVTGQVDTGNLTPDGQIGPDRLIVYNPDKVQSSKGPVINYREGRGQQNRKIAGLKLFSSRQGKAVCAPPPLHFNEWKRFAPSFSMARTSSPRVKTIPKYFVPRLFSMAKTCPSPLKL